jgi:hypothetical protein
MNGASTCGVRGSSRRDEEPSPRARLGDQLAPHVDLPRRWRKVRGRPVECDHAGHFGAVHHELARALYACTPSTDDDRARRARDPAHGGEVGPEHALDVSDDGAPGERGADGWIHLRTDEPEGDHRGRGRRGGLHDSDQEHLVSRGFRRSSPPTNFFLALGAVCVILSLVDGENDRRERRMG